MTKATGQETLLVVDDDPGILRTLKWSLDGYVLVTAASRPEALEALRLHNPKVVTLDLGLPPAVDEAREGLQLLDEILAFAPTTKVVVVSGNDEREHAVAAIGRGAWDFYSKPIDVDVLDVIVRRAFHVHALEAENRRLRREGTDEFAGLITGDAAMMEACKLAERVAPTDTNVLITGESGTGKELVARAIHRLSDRRDGPFVAINCAAIPEALLESELFGHEKGAFTSADRMVKGKIELAHGGTLFLDEIGDMPAALQAKLLRVTQDHQIERVGGRQRIDVDLRIVSATHRDLRERIASGLFREDLFYRLHQIGIEIPPLRARGEDAILLARHIAERFAIEQRRQPPQFTQGALVALKRHGWPGNVREVENRVRRAVIMSDSGMITPGDLDLEEPEARSLAAPAVRPGTTLREAREAAEREAILLALRGSGGNLSAAARELGVSRPTLYNLLRNYRIDVTAGGDEIDVAATRDAK
jgi:two-component system NtrC family response regulator